MCTKEYMYVLCNDVLKRKSSSSLFPIIDTCEKTHQQLTEIIKLETEIANDLSLYLSSGRSLFNIRLVVSPKLEMK